MRPSLSFLFCLILLLACRGEAEDSASPGACSEHPCEGPEVGPWTEFGITQTGSKDHTLVQLAESGEIHVIGMVAPESPWAGRPYPLYHLIVSEPTGLARAPVHAAAIDLAHPTWSAQGIWAPHLVRDGDEWYLFYTGVRWDEDPSLHEQRIGMASSSNLASFELAGGSGLVLDGTADWSSWGSGEPWRNDCRDPFVHFEDEKAYMLASMRRADGLPVIGIAQRHGGWMDLDWRWIGSIEATMAPSSTGRAESPNLLRVGESLYLFWTTLSGIRVAVSDSGSVLGNWTLLETSIGGFANETLRLTSSDSRERILFTHITGLGMEFHELCFEDRLQPSLVRLRFCTE